MTDTKHSEHSSIREEYLEYIFLGRLCSYAWQADRFVEVARAHTDAFGYDLVLNCEGVTRHIQLKASVSGGKTSRQKVNSALAEKQSGCVLWMVVDPNTLEPTSYLWFGGKPNEGLPELGNIVGKHSKGTATGEKNVRPSIREINKGRFEQLDGIETVFSYLFGKEN
jgi:hypothetical protein